MPIRNGKRRTNKIKEETPGFVKPKFGQTAQNKQSNTLIENKTIFRLPIFFSNKFSCG